MKLAVTGRDHAKILATEDSGEMMDVQKAKNSILKYAIHMNVVSY